MFGAEGIFPQVLEIRLRRAVFLDLCLAGRVELDVLRIDDHVHAFEPSQLPELRVVNEACAAPRRPSTTTSRILLWRSLSSAWSAMSVLPKASGETTSMRVTSIATLPLPTTTARSQDRSTGRSR